MISGLLQPGFVWTDGDGEAGGSFLVRRARLKASGTLGAPQLGYVVQLDFAAAQKPLRDAYVSLADWGQELRVGQFKVPFGWEAQFSLNRLPLIDHSLVQLVATPVNFRDIGVGLFGATDIGGGWSLQNALAVVNGEGPNTRDVSAQKDVYARVGVLKKNRFWLGVSAAGGDTERDGLASHTRRLGADAGVHVGPLQLISEYAVGTFEDEQEILAQAFYFMAIARVVEEVDLVCRYEATAGELEHIRYVTGGTTIRWAPLGARLQLNYRHGLNHAAENAVLAQAEYTF